MTPTIGPAPEIMPKDFFIMLHPVKMCKEYSFRQCHLCQEV